MDKPKSKHAKDIVDELPYIGEYYQPDDRVYLKEEMDQYIRHLTSSPSRAADECEFCEISVYPFCPRCGKES